MQRTLSYRHRVITDADLVLIRRLIAENPLCSRRRLSDVGAGANLSVFGRSESVWPEGCLTVDALYASH